MKYSLVDPCRANFTPCVKTNEQTMVNSSITLYAIANLLGTFGIMADGIKRQDTTIMRPSISPEEAVTR